MFSRHTVVLFTCLFGGALWAPAGDPPSQQEILLRTHGASVNAVAAKYGLNVLDCTRGAQRNDRGNSDERLCRVGVGSANVADLLASLAADPMVIDAEQNSGLLLPSSVLLDQSTV
jgi:hypothetical protein